MGGKRKPETWRYAVIKRYKNRASKFMDESRTPEEWLAWMKVVQWFDSILDHRFLNKNGSIAIPEILEVAE